MQSKEEVPALDDLYLHVVELNHGARWPLEEAHAESLQDSPKLLIRASTSALESTSPFCASSAALSQ